MTSLPAWWEYTIRLGAALLALAFLRVSGRGLLGRPLLVPRRPHSEGPFDQGREVRGWTARVFGLIGLLCAIVLFLVAVNGLAR